MNMKNDLTILSRIAIAFASGMLVTVFFLPAWRIDLFAPQYPEGLMMNVAGRQCHPATFMGFIARNRQRKCDPSRETR